MTATIVVSALLAVGILGLLAIARRWDHSRPAHFESPRNQERLGL